MWEGLIFLAMAGLAFKLDQSLSRQTEARKFKRAKEEGKQYQNLTMATIALIEEAYLKS